MNVSFFFFSVHTPPPLSFFLLNAWKTIQIMDMVAKADVRSIPRVRHLSLLKGLFDALVKAEAYAAISYLTFLLPFDSSDCICCSSYSWSAAMIWLKRLQQMGHDITFEQYRKLLDLLRRYDMHLLII
jgi:hypothetical protein